MIGRREFITLLGGAAVAWPAAAGAQQPALPVVGLLYGVSAAEWVNNLAGFRRGLNDAGFFEGRNVAIEYRWADGHFDRLPAMAADLVGRKVSVILVGGSTLGVRAALAATQSTPIVFTTGTNPVAMGFVASFARPGANATGITLFNGELVPKRLELLHEVVPTASKIALLVNSSDPAISQVDIQGAQAAARRLGFEIIVVDARSESEIDQAFAIAVQQAAAALYVGSDSLFSNRRAQIAALSLRHALPAISEQREAAAAGQLMSYGSDSAVLYRQAGVYVGRILKGEKPADLPVVQPTKFELVINLKTAKALGLTVPPSILLRADEVIE
jgi:putative ABC transport system substrate-binding protein